MEKKINLEKILVDIFPEEESGYSYESVNPVFKAYIKKSMLEFGKQLLELAAENVIVDGDRVVDKESILETIKQVE